MPEIDLGVKVGDIMHAGVITVEKDDNIAEAARKMLKYDIDSLLIIEDGVPAGIITKSDILANIVENGNMNAKVETVMNSPVNTISADDNVIEALKMMGKRGITKIPVMYKGKIRGIITQEDLLRSIPGLFDLMYAAGEQGRQISTAEQYEIEKEAHVGYCDQCKAYSEDLTEYENELLCGKCRADKSE
ncbi:MAG: CBS domain-containing protein [Candidatus Diapherotrites archaeon]|nr:CBS domain-containing protein [Candidatus Diapherotrites archaeon]